LYEAPGRFKIRRSCAAITTSYTTSALALPKIPIPKIISKNFSASIALPSNLRITITAAPRPDRVDGQVRAFLSQVQTEMLERSLQLSRTPGASDETSLATRANPEELPLLPQKSW
jgi:hypothetical protein